MDDLGKLLDEFLETVDFERGAHDDQHVWFAGEVGGLDGAYVVA